MYHKMQAIRYTLYNVYPICIHYTIHNIHTYAIQDIVDKYMLHNSLSIRTRSQTKDPANKQQKSIKNSQF